MTPDDYRSGNGFGGSASDPSSDDFDPTPEQIDQWQGSEDHSPSNDQTGEPSEQQEPESPEQDKQQRDVKQKAQPDKRTPLQKHRDSQKTQWDKEKGELYKQNRLLSKQLRDVQTELQRIQQGADKTPEEWLKLAEQFEQYGDIQRANEARAEAQRVHQVRGQFQNQQAHEQAWRANEQEIFEQDPDIFTEGTDTQQRLQKLFSDPDLRERYMQHPDGIWAAYHRVKLEHSMELIPKLVKVIETQQAELETLQKGNSPLVSKPGARSSGPKSLGNMSEDELEKAALAEANAIDSGRRY